MAKDKYFFNESDKIIDVILSDQFDLEKLVKEMNKELYSGAFKWSFSSADLSKRDLSFVPVEKLMRLPFGNYTIWPSKDKMPKNFEPDKIIEDALHFIGNDVESLRKKGLKGKGTTIAFIDMPFNRDHIELEGSDIEYVEFEKGASSHFHGLVTSSYLVGKNLGVAPESKLIFYAASCGKQGKNEIQSMIENEFKAILDVIDRSRKGEKIDIVGQSGSIEYHISMLKDEEKEKYYTEKFNEIKNELKKENIFYLSSQNFFDMFSYCRKVDPTKNNYDLDNYVNAFSKRNVDSNLPSVIPVGKLSPIDDTKDGYKYENCAGSASWSIPLVVGMFALCRQLSKDVSFEKFYDIVRKTAKTNANGLSLISMEGAYKTLSHNKELLK